jgi:hypothetical protein
MDSRMLHQVESQTKHHQVLVDGCVTFSSDVLLEALLNYNETRKKYASCNVEFKSVCTYRGN